MEKFIFGYLMSLFFISSNIYSQSSNLSAKEIVAKADQKLRGKSNKAEISMEIIRPSWKREMSLKSWSKGEDFSLVLITAPAKDKGTVSLKRENELWNWMPSIERTIKISPSMMSQSWMGSDFTNDDLLKQSSIVLDYNHEIVGEEKIDELDCYKIKLIPKEDAAVVWGKILMWVSKEGFHQLKTEFYDEDEILINRMLGKEIRQMGDREIITKMIMIPVEDEGHKTVITYHKIEFDISLNDNFFSMQNMKRVR